MIDCYVGPIGSIHNALGPIVVKIIGRIMPEFQLILVGDQKRNVSPQVAWSGRMWQAHHEDADLGT